MARQYQSDKQTNLGRAEAEKRVEQTINELKELGLQADEDQGLAPKELRGRLVKALYSDNGKKLLDKFYREYEEAFATFVQEADRIRTKLCVLYMFSDNYGQFVFHNKDFYRELAEKYHVGFID